MLSRDELLARRDELRERFAEKAVDPVIDSTVGLTLVSTGVAVGVTMIMRGRRGVLPILLSLGLVFAGLAVMSGGAYGRRTGRISHAEDVLREHLLGLDPLARAQVLREVVPQAFPMIRHAHN
jgi:hypothetical protein